MAGRSGTRITDSPDFDRAYRGGLAYRGKLFSVHAFENGLGHPRLGLSVSKKVGNAVVRNTVRRRLREAFHNSRDEIPVSLDLVVSARPAASDSPAQDLETELLKALKRFSRTG
ncbi:MAG: ribonuclease P protein component [Rubrobacter sp.]